MSSRETAAAKRPASLTPNGDLVAQALTAGLNLSALAEEAIADALGRAARDKFVADIPQACRVHEQYLADYGSLGETVRKGLDAE